MPNTVFYNLNSLSYYYKTNKAQRRHQTVIRNLLALKNKHNIICLQETHLKQYEKLALVTQFPDWAIFYSNAPTTKKTSNAGLITLISPTYLSSYHPHQLDLGPDGYGHIQIIHFKPINDSACQPFNIMNLYLTSGADFKAKARELTLATEAGTNTEDLAIVGGDFNFIEHEEDTTGKGCFLDHKTKQVWTTFLSHYKLYEIDQPLHTYHMISNNESNLYSSRLDRIYVNYNESDLTLNTPNTHLPAIPYDPLTLHAIKRDPNNAHLIDYLACPDHHPIAITFHTTNPNNHRKPPSIPKWLPKTRFFGDSVRCKWDKTNKNQSAFRLNEELKKIMMSAKTLFF